VEITLMAGFFADDGVADKLRTATTLSRSRLVVLLQALFFSSSLVVVSAIKNIIIKK